MKTLEIQPSAYSTKIVTLRVPELTDVQNLKVGDQAPNCFGGVALVTRIGFRGTDVYGAEFVGYVAATNGRDTISNGCGCSMTMKVGELMRTVAATNLFLSADLDTVESCIKAGKELPGYLALGSRREVA